MGFEDLESIDDRARLGESLDEEDEKEKAQQEILEFGPVLYDAITRIMEQLPEDQAERDENMKKYYKIEVGGYEFRFRPSLGASTREAKIIWSREDMPGDPNAKHMLIIRMHAPNHMLTLVKKTPDDNDYKEEARYDAHLFSDNPSGHHWPELANRLSKFSLMLDTYQVEEAN